MTTAAARVRQTARNPLRAGWLFTAILALLTPAVWLAVPSGEIHVGFELTWWFVALTAFAAESLVIHLEYRKDAHSFSMGEIALVVALFSATPSSTLTGWLIGSAAALVFSRRQTLLKISFNIAQYALNAGVAVFVFRVILPDLDPLQPRAVVATLAAVAAALIVSEASIVIVILLTGGQMKPKDVLETVSLGLFGTLLSGTLGLLVVVLAVAAPWAVWIGAVPPAIMYLAYRSHAEQRNQTERLQSMHRVTESIHTAPVVDEAMAAAASSARQLVEATWVEIVVIAGGFRALRTFADDSEALSMVPTVIRPELVRWWPRVFGEAGTFMDREGSSAVTAAPPIRKDMIVVPIIGTEAIHGYLLAADRVGDVSSFDLRDARLLESVAKQVSVALDNGMLETSLAAVTELKERLEEMVESKDRFIASISHELRTPLTAVVGLSQELDRNMHTFSTEDVAEFIHMISDQATELSHIIEDLLVAARADIGTLAVRPERLDVMATVEALTSPSLAFAGSDPLPIIGDAPYAFADGVRFRQVLRNLLTNARRYGGENVYVEVGSRGKLVTVTVVDDGEGVPDDRIEAIFEPYERAHAEPTQPGSVGLGLSVARQLTRMMGGDLGYSRIDGTTRFEMSVPRYIEASRPIVSSRL
ncbi:MAG: HAMP domain-containing histidine kinase [Acidimicrobiia bacterium]|nr:HAMP domain-containing histidine kinase [Acidimicrobiia bacterium]